jgi:hypothetical protein
MSKQTVTVKCQDCGKEWEVDADTALADTQIPENHIWVELTNVSNHTVRHIRPDEEGMYL